MYNAGGNTPRPDNAEARAVGIGVEGVDTIGVGGITTLLKRWWNMQELYQLGGADYGTLTKQSGVAAYVREEITNDSNYAVDNNYAAGTDILKEI